MAAATFQHRAFKIGDAKDIDLALSSVLNATGIAVVSMGYIGVLGGAAIQFGANGNATTIAISASQVFFPIQAPTASAPAYVKGGIYYDTTLNKIRVGGAAGWETVTSV
jgi:hypothetical protein